MLVLLRNKARDSGEAGSRAPGEPGEVGLEAAPAAWSDVSGEPGLSAKLTDLTGVVSRVAPSSSAEALAASSAAHSTWFGFGLGFRLG